MDDSITLLVRAFLALEPDERKKVITDFPNDADLGKAVRRAALITQPVD